MIDIRGPSCREVRRGELPASPGEEERRLRGERHVPPCPTLYLSSLRVARPGTSQRTTSQRTRGLVLPDAASGFFSNISE